jgi:hypothetical protein
MLLKLMEIFEMENVGRLKFSTGEFIKIAKKLHYYKYDYSKTLYKGLHKKIKYVCPIHGEIEQTAHNHIYNKHGCYKCGLDKLKNSRRKTTKDFVTEAKMLFGNKYDYSLVTYINNKTKVKIICKEHGIFEMTPNNHLNLGQECKFCKNDNN